MRAAITPAACRGCAPFRRAAASASIRTGLFHEEWVSLVFASTGRDVERQLELSDQPSTRTASLLGPAAVELERRRSDAAAAPPRRMSRSSGRARPTSSAAPRARTRRDVEQLEERLFPQCTSRRRGRAACASASCSAQARPPGDLLCERSAFDGLEYADPRPSRSATLRPHRQHAAFFAPRPSGSSSGVMPDDAFTISASGQYVTPSP